MLLAAVDDWTLNFSALYLPLIYSMNVFIHSAEKHVPAIIPNVKMKFGSAK